MDKSEELKLEWEWVKRAKQRDPVALQWAFKKTRRVRELEPRKWFASPEDIRDAEQEAAIGLLHAIDKYKLTGDKTFSKYANWHIRHRIQRYFDKTVFPLRLPSWIHDKRRKFIRLAASAGQLCAMMARDRVPVATATIAAHITASPSADGPGEQDDNPHMVAVIANHEIPSSPFKNVAMAKEEAALLKELLNSLPVYQATLLRRVWKIGSDELGPAHVLQEMNLSMQEGNELHRMVLIRLRRHPLLKEFERRFKFSRAENLPDYATIRKCPRRRRKRTRSTKSTSMRKGRGNQPLIKNSATPPPLLDLVHT